ncbi:MAG: amino acid permease, partial [Tenuifilaceae bacterium]
LLLFFIVGFFIARNDEAVRLNREIFWQGQQLVDGKPVPLSGISLIIALGIAMVGSLFAADAWNNVTFASEEIKDPKRTIPLSMVLGVVIVIVLYMLVNYIYIKVLPVRGSPDATTVMGQGMQYASNDRVGTAAMYGTFGESAAIIMAILIMISTFGCVNGMILSGARVYYAMAKDGLFFKQVGILNSMGVPGVSLALQCAWACILCLSGTYSNLLDYVIFSVLIFYVLSVVGVFILRVKKPDVARPYKTWGYPVTPAVYILACTFIMVILLIYKPAYTWPGLIIVILGIPVYYLWKRPKFSRNKRT